MFWFVCVVCGLSVLKVFEVECGDDRFVVRFDAKEAKGLGVLKDAFVFCERST